MEHGFKPDNGAKKLFTKSGSWNCAYVYTDGVIMVESRTCKSGKITFDKRFSHIFPCDIPVYVLSPPCNGFNGRLVVHNPSILADGIQRIEIYLDNKSQAMEQMGITCNTVNIITQSGMKIREHIFPFISSEVTIQNESKQSIEGWDDVDAIWHNKKEERLEEAV